MKVKLSLEDLVKAYRTIGDIEKEKACPKFSFAIAKNLGKMKADIDGVKAAEKEMAEVEKSRIDYCEKNCTKDKDGKPVTAKDAFGNDTYTGIDFKAPEFLVIIEKKKKLEDEHSVFLQTEVEIDFHMIDFSDLPEKISPFDTSNLLCMINEPKEEKK